MIEVTILCPTCKGKGTINDPTISGNICYNGANGETCPQTTCLTCMGIGWIRGYKTEPWLTIPDNKKQ